MNLEKEIERLNGIVQQLLQRVTYLEEENMLLKAENALIKAENALLKEENTKLKARVKELEAKLKQNSGNSSKPPSSDFLKKTAFPRTKGGKRGGKEGHDGNTLKMVENPDEVIAHSRECCRNCGKNLEGQEGRLSEEKRQVVDIIMPPAKVTEHRYLITKCTCGYVNCGAFPQTVTQPVQYGPNIKALWLVWNNECKMPYEKISQVSADLFGINATPATIMNTQEQCYEALEEVSEYIKKAVCSEPIVHFDETGARTAGKGAWVHVASSNRYTHFFAHERRGKEALTDEDSIIPNFKGHAIHDCWGTYFKFNCQHGLCAAHLLRELTALIEQKSQWASDMHKLLMEAYHNSEKGTKAVTDFDKLQQQYLEICDHADKEEPPIERKAKTGKPKRSKGRNLMERLVKHKDAVLAFAKYEDVPFTNNLAERDIRNVKTKLKVATSFRTFKGLKIYARAQGFISTLKKQQLNVFFGLKAIFEGTFSLATLR